MIIICYRLIPNPLPDFQEKPIKEKIAIELSDEEIIRLGRRYFTLMNGKAQFDMGGKENAND